MFRIRFLLVAFVIALGVFFLFNSFSSLNVGIFSTPVGENTEEGLDFESGNRLLENEVNSGLEAGFDTDLDSAPQTFKTKEEKSILPEPLKVFVEPSESALTISGVVFWTNIQRTSENLDALSGNLVLDRIASLRLEDMFKRQYFDHISPSGDSVEDVAYDLEYRYLVIGENLAMGGFESDEDLVDAWMDSPGHRENILNENYEEIGIAVGRDVFEGREVWLAVQVFGLPSSACPSINEELKDEIDEKSEDLEEMAEELEGMRDDIYSAYPRTGPTYRQKINTYNGLVAEYNSVVGEIKVLIALYNSQVSMYNSCLGSLGL